MKDKNASVSYAENPLYEKLYSRFSYNGRTVGEMMLSRAAGNGFPIGSHERNDLHCITAESHITNANFLPTCDGDAALLRPPFYHRSPICEKRTLLSAALAMLLCLSFVLFLSFSALSRSNDRGNLGSLELNEAKEMMVLQEEVLPSL